MSKSSKDYSKGRIYCIRNWVSDDIYVGHTTQALSRRMEKHRSDCKSTKYGNFPLYKKMREIGIEHFYIEKIQDCPDCKNVEDLRKIEGEWIRKMGTLNKQIAGRTQEQYNLDTIERRQEYIKHYQEENRDKKRVYDKEYYKENRNKKLEQFKKYNKEHAPEIKKKWSVKVECECGGRYTLSHKAEHFKCKKHQNYLNKNIYNDEIPQEKQEDRHSSSSTEATDELQPI